MPSLWSCVSHSVCGLTGVPYVQNIACRFERRNDRDDGSRGEGHFCSRNVESVSCTHRSQPGELDKPDLVHPQTPNPKINIVTRVLCPGAGVTWLCVPEEEERTVWPVTSPPAARSSSATSRHVTGASAQFWSCLSPNAQSANSRHT